MQQIIGFRDKYIEQPIRITNLTNYFDKISQFSAVIRHCFLRFQYIQMNKQTHIGGKKYKFVFCEIGEIDDSDVLSKIKD